MQTMDDSADGYVVPQCGDSPCSDDRGNVSPAPAPPPDDGPGPAPPTPPTPPAPNPAGIWEGVCIAYGGGGARQNRQTYAGSTVTSVTNYWIADATCTTISTVDYVITAEASVSIGSGSSFDLDGAAVSGGEYDLTITSATATPLTAGGVAAVDALSSGSSTIGAAISVLSSLFGTGADLELYGIYYIDTTAHPDDLYVLLATAADGGRPTSMQTTDDSADDYVVPVTRQ